VVQQVANFYARGGQLAKAEPLLRQLLDPKSAAAAPVRITARRALALALAGGNYRRLREALALLDENGKEGSATAADQQARALVYASHPGHRREAIRLFETLPAHQGPTPAQVHIVLAELYEAEGNWPKARSHCLSLLGLDENNPAYVAHYLRALLRNKAAADAQVWLDRLTTLAPAAQETYELRARLLHAQGSKAEATTVITRAAEQSGARLDAFAALLDELGQPTEAEKLYRAHVAASSRPEAVLLLARHLARRDRLPEALDLCEKAWQTCPPEAVASAAVAALRAGRPGEDQHQRVEQWLRKALERQPQSRLLPALLAQLLDSRGRHEEAIGLYRGLLRVDPNNVAVLNNLAYLVSLKEGRHEEARKLIDAAIEAGGPLPDLLDTSAVINLRDNKPDLAAKDLQEAIRQAPSPDKYFHLAQSHRSTKNRSAAVTAFRQATALGLKASDLHVLEQADFRQLASDLNVN
jgi:tetratricopeptide (TPR) repeat protein